MPLLSARSHGSEPRLRSHASSGGLSGLTPRQLFSKESIKVFSLALTLSLSRNGGHPAKYDEQALAAEPGLELSSIRS